MRLLDVGGSFAVICTGQNKLSGLAGLVRLIELGPLEQADSQSLVQAVVGAGDLTQEQVDGLIAACSGHPLALQIAAAHVTRRRLDNVDVYLAELADPDHGLQALAAGQSTVESAMDRAYDALDPTQVRLFQTLGALPHMSFTCDIAAAAVRDDLDAMGDEAVRRARRVLDELFELSLLEQIDGDRFMLHGVVHRFARLKSCKAGPERSQAALRHAGLVLSARLRQAFQAIGYEDDECRSPASGNADAIASLEADRPGAIAVLEMARCRQDWSIAVALASELTFGLRLRGRWRDLKLVYEAVLEAGRASNNAEWQALAAVNIGSAHAHQGETEAAVDSFQRAAQIAHDNALPHLAHLANVSYGSLLINTGRAAEAIPFIKLSARAWRIIGDDQLLADALHNLATANRMLGRTRRADQYHRNSTRLAKRASQPTDEEAVPRGDSSGTTLQETATAAKALGDPQAEARALTRLGLAQYEQGQLQEARASFTECLRLYESTDDNRGQCEALLLLAKLSSGRGDSSDEIGHLQHCAELAAWSSDVERGTEAHGQLGLIFGCRGQLDVAEQYFAVAEQMAEDSGSPRLMANVAIYKGRMHLNGGRPGQAIAATRTAMQWLAETDDAETIAAGQELLGATLLAAGRTREAAPLLSEVAENVSGLVSKETQARAQRSLGVLYAGQDLHQEAEPLLQAALAHAVKSGNVNLEIATRLALANMHAGAGQWQNAVPQYKQTAELAQKSGDLNLLTTALAMLLTANMQEPFQPSVVEVVTEAIRLADADGSLSIRLGLQSNLATYLAKAGHHQEALHRYEQVADLAAQVGDIAVQAKCSANQARSLLALEDVERARQTALHAAKLFDMLGNAHDAARSLAVVLSAELQETGTICWEGLLEEAQAQSISPDALHALQRALDLEPPEGTTFRAAAQRSREIRIGQEVRQQLDGLELEPMYRRWSQSHQTCVFCDLDIAETGIAEVILIDDSSSNLVIRLAHPKCSRSRVVQASLRNGQPERIHFEVECILFGGNVAGIVVDCYGGWGIPTDGATTDIVLEALRKIGFTDIDSSSAAAGIEPETLKPSDLNAQLNIDTLQLFRGDEGLLEPMPLSFLPHWYQKAKEGILVAVFGRNLRGMAADDSSYLKNAIESGNVVAAVLPLHVIAPARNNRCVCTPSSGLKFKQCCGYQPTNMEAF